MELCTLRSVYRRVAEIVNANSDIDKGSTFHELIVRGFATYASLEVRKQSDRQIEFKRQPRRSHHKQNIGVYSLMSDIASHPYALTRRRLLSAYKGAEFWTTERAHEDIGRIDWMGPVHADAKAIRRDQRAPRLACHGINHYVNRYFAHANVRPPSNVPTFSELDVAIDTIQENLKRCLHVLQGHSPEEFTGHILQDWESVFRIRWIPEEEWE